MNVTSTIRAVAVGICVGIICGIVTFVALNSSVTLWIAGLSAAAQISLIPIAIYALAQISEQRKQTALTRETVAIEELRHFEKFLADSDGFRLIINSRQHGSLPNLEMRNFNAEEASKSPEFSQGIKAWESFYGENADILSSVIACANSLEIIATALEHGTAKLEIIETPIAPAFCGFVEGNAYVYVLNRNKKINLFVNTISLYKKLKPKVSGV